MAHTKHYIPPNTMSNRYPKPNRSTTPSTSSSSPPSHPHNHRYHYNSNTHHHTSSSSTRPSSSILLTPDHHHHPSPDVRRRRGRQARPSQLSSKMRRACHTFSDAVGAPNVVEPAGFRDFRGWLTRLNSRQSYPLWDHLLAAIASEVDCDRDALHALKEDIVREIIKRVVVPRPDESAKLVSTNAGRQASVPRSGTTLMVVLEQQLDRVEKRLPQLVAQVAGGGGSMAVDGGGRGGRRDVVMTSVDGRGGMGRQRGGFRGGGVVGSSVDHARGQLPPVSDILGHAQRHSTLPSFRELEDSIERSRRSRRSG